MAQVFHSAVPFLSAPSRLPNAAFSGLGRRHARMRGFTLIEVALAILVVAVAFVPVFGLMPVGLTTFRQAVDTTIGSQIVHRIISEAQQTDFSVLTNAQSYPQQRYFDDQGNEVAQSAAWLYSADISVSGVTALPNASAPDSPSLATVIVKLANNPRHAPSTNTPYTAYSALIAKNQ